MDKEISIGSEVVCIKEPRKIRKSTGLQNNIYLGEIYIIANFEIGFYGELIILVEGSNRKLLLSSFKLTTTKEKVTRKMNIFLNNK